MTGAAIDTLWRGSARRRCGQSAAKGHSAAGRSGLTLGVLLGLVFILVAPVFGETARRQTTLELTIVGGAGLNPNAQGRASPVEVRIFDLSATQAFQAAPFDALLDHAGESLKKDISAQEELVLRPGAIEERSRSLSATTVAIGIAAGFRELEHGTWHLAVALKPGRHNFVLIDLDRNEIRVETLDSDQS